MKAQNGLEFRDSARPMFLDLRLLQQGAFSFFLRLARALARGMRI
jgi:hypothetical protein